MNIFGHLIDDELLRPEAPRQRTRNNKTNSRPDPNPNFHFSWSTFLETLKSEVLETTSQPHQHHQNRRQKKSAPTDAGSGSGPWSYAGPLSGFKLDAHDRNDCCDGQKYVQRNPQQTRRSSLASFCDSLASETQITVTTVNTGSIASSSSLDYSPPQTRSRSIAVYSLPSQLQCSSLGNSLAPEVDDHGVEGGSSTTYSFDLFESPSPSSSCDDNDKQGGNSSSSSFHTMSSADDIMRDFGSSPAEFKLRMREAGLATNLGATGVCQEYVREVRRREEEAVSKAEAAMDELVNHESTSDFLMMSISSVDKTSARCRELVDARRNRNKVKANDEVLIIPD